MKILSGLIFGVCVAGLTGCQQMPLENENSPYYTPPIGSLLILHKEFTIQPNQVSVYLQNGGIVHKSQIDQYYANCKFEVKTIKTTAQFIVPDTFEIVKIRLDYNLVLYNKVIVASRVVLSGSASATAEVFSTTYYLRSAKQPNVLYLTCEHWEDPADGAHLTLAQIRQTLGDIMTIQIR